MAQILVRNLDKQVIDRLKERARAGGRSLQMEVKLILEDAIQAPKLDMAMARKISEEFQRRFQDRQIPHTVALIREDRER
ncbi:MAG: hypothetical protein HYY29_00540 [Chloroflexi bacterium]|nr:hypothetical protein [Chloroflexota bacterium]